MNLQTKKLAMSQESLEAEVKKLETKKTALQEQIQQLQSLALAHQQNLQTAKNSVSKQVEDDKAKLLQSLSKLEGDLADIKVQVTEKKLIVENLDKLIRNGESAVRELGIVQDSMNNSIKMSQQKLDVLDTVDAKITEAKVVLTDTESKIDSAKAILTGFEDKITQSKSTLEDTNDLVEQSKNTLDGLQADFDMRKNKLDDELKGVLLRTQDAVARLKRVQDEEESERRSISVERQALAKERESLNILKIKLGGAESRIKKLDGLIKL